jgi:hypothetical protein
MEDCTCCSDGTIKTSSVKVKGIIRKKTLKPTSKPKSGHPALAKTKREIEQSKKGTYTVTFGEVAENGVRMEKIGKEAERGLSVAELANTEQMLNGMGIETEMIDITEALTEAELTYLKTPEGQPAKIKNPKLPASMKDKSMEATILIIRNGAELLMGEGSADKMLLEQQGIKYDTKKIWYGKPCNSHARHNVCFSTYDQVMDLDNKQGTIVDFKHLPVLEGLRNMLPTIVPALETNKVELKGEGNYYFNLGTCGIGWHGDKERKIVIAVRLGEPMGLYYHWYYGCKQVGSRVDVDLNHGDMYIMSEKAVGTDSGRSVILTLRHGAGVFKDK